MVDVTGRACNSTRGAWGPGYHSTDPQDCGKRAPLGLCGTRGGLDGCVPISLLEWGGRRPHTGFAKHVERVVLGRLVLRASVRHTAKMVQKWFKIIKIPLGFSLKVKM